MSVCCPYRIVIGLEQGLAKLSGEGKTGFRCLQSAWHFQALCSSQPHCSQHPQAATIRTVAFLWLHKSVCVCCLHKSLLEPQVRPMRIYMVYLWIHNHNPSYRIECTNDPFTCIPCRYRLMADNTTPDGHEALRDYASDLGYSVLLCYLVLEMTK